MIKRKKLGGFTLVEIIVALAVFSIMSLVVALIIQMSSTIIKDSQYTTQKANAHAVIAKEVVAVRESGYDEVTTKQQITLNGVALTNVDVVEIEKKTYDGSSVNREASPDDTFYAQAPNLKVFTAGT
ncbi:MAG: type II secretion system protein [Oscillospiraceae bacterium]|nr:type II secretion system protein [Oscillospiraceae bacterium]